MEASESRIAADKQPFLDQAVRGALTRYGIATAAITIVLGVKLAFVWPVLGHEKPLHSDFATIAFCAWQGGTGPALWALFLGSIASAYFFLPLEHTFLLMPRARFQLVVFVLECTTITLLSETLRRAQKRAVRSERHLSTTLDSIGDAIIVTTRRAKSYA